ncbi:GNAT family N-acetyltransferase [Glycomyces tritici]|uniref:GNAT family N-acetyltransferase n=1 Tax=Glycomyces tritici TaxID=2665176 RepID=A0ABT7YL74_9ACTN|nr:GNAT family N-acetyltransferase [Glycomyces tritici]MDN3239356.1 GNAT family N-acetyltransferase [Glycomyces tritici]
MNRKGPADLKIRLVDPADEPAVDRAHAVQEAARAFDHPETAPEGRRRFGGFLAQPPQDTQVRCYLAEIGGTAAGVLVMHLLGKENAHYAETEMAVHPDHRRRGVGTALLERLLETAREEVRTEVVVLARIAVEGGPARIETGARFLEKRGFTAALAEIDRSLRLDTVDPAAETRLWDESIGAAADYELVSWTGRTPEQYLEGLSRIDSQIFTEIPLGEVDLRPRTIDTAYVIARDDRAEAQGDTVIRTVAVHRPTGEIAANTVIYIHGDEAHARQAITIVDPAHRGHRLGLLAKLANHRRLREHRPEVTTVWTGNADTNVHMAAINELLGFRPVDACVSYQRKLA